MFFSSSKLQHANGLKFKESAPKLVLQYSVVIGILVRYFHSVQEFKAFCFYISSYLDNFYWPLDNLQLLSHLNKLYPCTYLKPWKLQNFSTRECSNGVALPCFCNRPLNFVCVTFTLYTYSFSYCIYLFAMSISHVDTRIYEMKSLFNDLFRWPSLDIFPMLWLLMNTSSLPVPTFIVCIYNRNKQFP